MVGFLNSFSFLAFFVMLVFLFDSVALIHLAFAKSTTTTTTTTTTDKTNTNNPWLPAKATAFGGDFTSTINGGACGYGDVYSYGYGPNTAAVSGALFNSSTSCGACYEIKCDDGRHSHGHGQGGSSPSSSLKQWCLQDSSVTVTATNLCPSNGEDPIGSFCDLPFKHFDISEPAFLQMAAFIRPGQALPVLFRRVQCERQGGMKFTINGDTESMVVLLTNVGGAGGVDGVRVRAESEGSSTWHSMRRLWGSNWSLSKPSNLLGQPLSFEVSLSDGNVVSSRSVTPHHWKFGETFEGSQAPRTG